MANHDFSDDDVRIDILTENMAQSVLNNLKALMSNQAHARTRWVWELLQNARDAGADVVSVKHDEDKVVFRHDGASFTTKEIGHLIYHGSTKAENPETIGQYGSGFLTTHLLSPEIRVSGRLEDGRSFRFRLRRELGSPGELGDSMERAWQDFRNSRNRSPADSGDSGTEFIYPLDNAVSDAVEAVEYGIAMLKRCAPFVVVFNEGFSSIAIESRSETTAFRATRRCPLAKGRGLHEVVVEETSNQNRIERRYVVAQGENAQVAIPVESNGGDTICAPIRGIPKLFLGFPLIGTEGFGFSAVINSLKFTPTEFRDGVYLGQSRDEANSRNQKIIEEACALLVKLIDFAAEYGWRNIPELARVPHTVNYNWLDEDWLKGRVKALFVEKVREKPGAINEAGKRIPLNALKLPFANTPEDTLTLWDLLAERDGAVETLPRRDEAAGWRDAVESWAGSLALTYREVIGGNRVAELIHNASRDPSGLTHQVSRLQLKEGVDAIGWLNKLIAFLLDSGLRNWIPIYRIVPSQAGILGLLGGLHRDKRIDEELKDIADLTIEWRVRPHLRDVCLTSLSDESGAGEWDNDYVVRHLIEKVNARAEKNPDEICHEASARLFAWIAGRQDWNTLRTLSIFSEEYEAANRQTTRDFRKLDNSPNQRDLPIAPVASWAEDLQPYSDLFPQRHTLADFYFDAVPDRETWDTLARMGFVRNGVIIAREGHPRHFLPDEMSDDEQHEIQRTVSLTDIAFISREGVGITERARRSRPLARTFWRFLTEWMTKHDAAGLEISEADCDCGKPHRYYPAEWLIPVSENRWVPFSAEGSRGARRATDQSLADLLRGSGWTPASLDDSPAAVKLLDAIGVGRFDLTRSFMAATAEERAEQDRVFINILDSTGGDLKPVREFTQDLKDDPGLIAHLAERRERRRVVHGNQRLGAQVEELVKLNLESAGFRVERTGTGSDFEIAPDDAARLELRRDGKTWLIEVKATRDSSVRMTHTQALTAVERRDGFLICVVPIDGAKPDPELDDVRASMRFVSDIGARLGEPMRKLGQFQRMAGNIAAANSDGVQLEVESGAARVRVANSVWENEGFPLDDLRGKLM